MSRPSLEASGSWTEDRKPDIYNMNGAGGSTRNGASASNGQGSLKRSSTEDSARKKRIKRSSGKACVYCRRRWAEAV